ncbi:hypothetical protein [Photobacterium damselae]|uniref:hypothetical protein n=1 Tax=Photobacterium damselae TaxID=38293 RepID=UPI004067A179
MATKPENNRMLVAYSPDEKKQIERITLNIKEQTGKELQGSKFLHFLLKLYGEKAQLDLIYAYKNNLHLQKFLSSPSVNTPKLVDDLDIINAITSRSTQKVTINTEVLQGLRDEFDTEDDDTRLINFVLCQHILTRNKECICQR